MATLPTGTVTFLFTDVEGSTRLLQQLGGVSYGQVRDRHAEILRTAIALGSGLEVSTGGDSFFAVFPDPVGAVEAVVAAQRELATGDWPHGTPPRVRMGLHTGEAVLGGDDYVGIDVHRAARITAAAHGGQVLVSEATRSLVEGSLPDGVSLRDLGVHRLKDLDRPEGLHQLVVEGLLADFPPLRTIDGRPTNLPPQLTSFVGRSEEIAEVQDLLGRTRLLTLTGAGGTGKTRLALQVASATLEEYRDGVYFVDLSSVTDPSLVASGIAQAMRIPETPGRPILDVVADYLRERELLLVVDNFEQVVEAGPVIEQLLTDAPRLTVIATSRIVLSLRGEQEYAVPPLALPDPGRVPDVLTLGRYEAVQLFTERAIAVRPGFRVTEENAPAVAEITARLDGLPLAIELAATRTKVLTPQQMLPRLQQRLSILTTGARTLPERQRTLRGAIAWSHDLLEESEQRLFARLSVFAGGWTLPSAEAVSMPEECGLDALEGLTSLVDKSLVRRTDANGQPRFAMLETIREFGYEQLAASGDLDVTRGRHGEHFLAFAVEAEPHLTTDEQGEWLDRCEQEHANIRSALRWGIDAGEAELVQRAAGALWRFWQQRGHLAEARRWFDEVLSMPAGQGATAPRAAALIGAGGIAWWQNDRPTSGRAYAEAVDIERALGDPVRLAEALYNLAFVLAAEDDMDGALRMLEESLELFRGAGHEQGVAQVLVMMVIRDAIGGAWDRVIERIEEVADIWRRMGNRYQLANDLVWLAIAYARVGRRADARSAALQSLQLFREVDNSTGIALALRCLAFLTTWEGRHEDAIRLMGASLSLDERVGAGVTTGFAGLLEGDPAEEAAAHLSEAAAEGALREGRAMSVEEAAALAGAPTPTPPTR
jgi:predicted ATPase/class 3 adenylate cyclase